MGHHDRTGLKDTRHMNSWNSSHGSRGCSQDNLKSTGGAGLIYCFLANSMRPRAKPLYRASASVRRSATASVRHPMSGRGECNKVKAHELGARDDGSEASSIARSNPETTSIVTPYDQRMLVSLCD